MHRSKYQTLFFRSRRKFLPDFLGRKGGALYAPVHLIDTKRRQSNDWNSTVCTESQIMTTNTSLRARKTMGLNKLLLRARTVNYFYTCKHKTYLLTDMNKMKTLRQSTNTRGSCPSPCQRDQQHNYYILIYKLMFPD